MNPGSVIEFLTLKARQIRLAFLLSHEPFPYSLDYKDESAFKEIFYGVC